MAVRRIQPYWMREPDLKARVCGPGGWHDSPRRPLRAAWCSPRRLQPPCCSRVPGSARESARDSASSFERETVTTPSSRSNEMTSRKRLLERPPWAPSPSPMSRRSSHRRPLGSVTGLLPTRLIPHQASQRTSPPTLRDRASRSVSNPWEVETMATPIPPCYTSHVARTAVHPVARLGNASDALEHSRTIVAVAETNGQRFTDWRFRLLCTNR